MKKIIEVICIICSKPLSHSYNYRIYQASYCIDKPLRHHLMHMLKFTNILLTLGVCARGMVVVLSVCLSVCYHASCYIPCFMSQIKCHRVLHGVFDRCIVWILLKTLRSKVLA